MTLERNEIVGMLQGPGTLDKFSADFMYYAFLLSQGVAITDAAIHHGRWRTKKRGLMNFFRVLRR